MAKPHMMTMASLLSNRRLCRNVDRLHGTVRPQRVGSHLDTLRRYLDNVLTELPRSADKRATDIDQRLADVALARVGFEADSQHWPSRRRCGDRAVVGILLFGVALLDEERADDAGLNHDQRYGGVGIGRPQE